MSSASPRMTGTSDQASCLDANIRKDLARLIARISWPKAAQEVGVAIVTLGDLTDGRPCKQEEVDKALSWMTKNLPVVS